MNKENEIHKKAIRLIEGGVVEVDNLCVKMRYGADDEVVCLDCEMDCICKRDSEMYDVCVECDSITRKGCILVLV